MKKIIAIAVFATISSGVFAQNKNIGCGLGTQVMEGKDSLVMQVLGATTNGTSGNQTFGISSGTLGCAKPAQMASVEMQQFVAGNMDTLAQDIAQGSGEALVTLSKLMDIATADRAEFAAKLQANFSTIYAQASVDSATVIDKIIAVL
jgi:Protein of unknown function (DUF3015)